MFAHARGELVCVLHCNTFLAILEMRGAPRIDELVFDERAERHVARHAVTWRDVEEAVFDPDALFFVSRKTRRLRYLVLARTEAGRHLFVVLAPFGRRAAYVITARDMTGREKRRYRRRRT